MVDDESTTRGPDTGVETNELVPIPKASDRAYTLAGRSGDRYRLGTPIGQGGMGEILGATDEQIGREVAVKRMKERHPSQHSMGRFFREACIQGRLDHPAIVPVHELGVDADGRPFFTMKKLAGTTLSQRIAAAHPRTRLLRAFADVCLAIQFAHERGVVHRDLKPDNVVLGDFGEVYVLDWGVAKVLAEPDDNTDESTSTTIVAEPMTVDGTIIGTRAYMAPEQARADKDIDGRADVYALGCVLFEILTGVPRNPKPDPDTALAMRPSERAIGRDVPPELDELCMTATAHERVSRIQTARELGERVERFLDGDRDLELRRELARGHLDAAREAFDAGDRQGADTAGQRRRAMREAGRALALDPKLAGAGELVSRLMLEPPRERPPEMQRLIDADNLETLRRSSKAGALSYLGFLGFLPLLVMGSSEHVWYIAVLCAIVALNLAFLLPEYSYKNLAARAVRIAIGNALMIALLARMCSPFLIAPAVAALSVMGMVFSPNYRSRRATAFLVVGLTVAVLGPWVAELAGWISPTGYFTDTGYVLQPPILGTSLPTRYLVLGLSVVAIIASAAGLGFQSRKAERIVAERLHQQAWQLRQLVS